MSNSTEPTTNCGCLTMILTILALWALWFGLPTPWGTFNIDIFPPQIRQVGGPTPKESNP